MTRMTTINSRQLQLVWEGFVLGGSVLQQAAGRGVDAQELKRRREVIQAVKAVSNEAEKTPENRLPTGAYTRTALKESVSLVLTQDAHELLIKYYTAAPWKPELSDEVADLLELLEAADKQLP